MSQESAPQVAAQVTLGQALQEYLSSLKPEHRAAYAAFVRKYVEHAGDDMPTLALTSSRVESYAESQIKGSDPSAGERVAALKSWFQFLRKRGYTEANLGIHIRVPRSPGRPGGAAHRARVEEAPVAMTPEGHEALRKELDDLNALTPELVRAITAAREDKDFRENAPLEAAREAMAFNDQRRKAIETALKRAVVAEMNNDGCSAVGSSVTVTRLDTGRQVTYKLVGAREANAAEFKISVESPVGRELLGRRVGEEVSVSVPSGVVQFRVDSISQA